MSQFLPLSILSGRSPAPRRRRSLGCGRRRPGSGPPAPSAATGAGARRHGSARAGGAWPQPKRGCGSGTETGLDRECPREPEDDREERKLYSLEAVRGFHRFDFSSLAAVAFFSVFLELFGMAVARVVRRFSSDLSLWTRFGGFPIVAQLLRELTVPCPI